MSTDTREPRIRAAVPCPLCGAGINQPCHQVNSPHNTLRGPEDRRPGAVRPLGRSHTDRRLAWQEYKRERGMVGDPVPETTREQKIRAAVVCPQCAAPLGQACHEDGQAMKKSHAERRLAWYEADSQ